MKHFVRLRPIMVRVGLPRKRGHHDDSVSGEGTDSVVHGAWDRRVKYRVASSFEGRIVEALRADPHAAEACLFESLARGEGGLASGVDVAVSVDPAVAAAGRPPILASLAASLKKALGTSEVNLIPLNDAPPVLYHRVLRDGRRLLSRDLRATTTREGHALSRYCDWVPQLAKIEAAHRRRIEAGEFGK